MLEAIRERYIFNKCQVIILDDDGIITLSDDHLFEVPNAQPIENVHPFFETIRHLFDDKNEEHVFHCIHLEIGDVIGNYNVIFNSGNKEQNPFLVLYDFTENCNYIQTIVQRRNESVIALEFEQIQAQRLQAEQVFKNKLIATISHDLRTPLTSIAGFAELLQKQQGTPQGANYVQLISQSATVIKDILDNLLGLAKLEAGVAETQLKKLHLPELTDYLEAIYAPKMQQKGLQFSLKKSAPKNAFIADTTRILQVIINLVDNAVKFTEKGSIQVFLSVLAEAATEPILQITVIDTGIGFPQEATEKIGSFQRFHSTDVEGSGLGLSIVQGVVKHLQGKLDIQSAPDKGTTVWVEIPIQYAAETATAVQTNSDASITLAPLKIIVADDNDVNILLFQQMLAEQENVQVIAVNDGNTVLDELQKQPVDAVFLDVHMDGLDGITT
ncbi:MAG: response regulator, partial [Bacteroidetes bacterium]